MYVTTEITIDFLRPRKTIMEVVQDDTTRKIRLILKRGGNDFNVSADLASGDSVVGAVAYLKPDGHGGVYDTTPDGETAVQLVSGTVNQFDVLLVGQVFTVAGWTQVNVKFYNADFSKVLSTFAINVNVQRNAASDYESEDYSNMESLGAIRAEMVAFEATVRDELAAFRDDPEFGHITLRDTYGGATIYGGYGGAENKPVIHLIDTGDGDLPVRITPVATPTLGTDAANKAYVDAKGGLSDEAKDALLNCFAHVAWVDEHGQDYYDALEAALYPTADLVSISAVFVQGQTVVYDTDSLDVLKPMLTVIAHYDDGTSATVTAYTLSGALTERTSTITVSYGGKTATFDVVVTDPTDLPSEYQKVEWVGVQNSTAKPTAYIYAGPDVISVGDTLKAEVKPFSIVGPYDSPLGLYGLSSAINWELYYTNNGNQLNTDGAGVFSSTSFVIGDWDEVTLKFAKATGLRILTYKTDAFAFNGKVKSLFIENANGTITHNYIPCYRKADGVIGVYDIVTSTFLTKSGSGSLVKGDDI